MIKIIATLLTFFAFSTSHAKTVNVGIILGFTGPIESLTPDMAADNKKFTKFWWPRGKRN